MDATMVKTDASGHAVVINATAIPVGTDDIVSALEEHDQPLVAAMVRWTEDTNRRAQRSGSIIDRDRYVTPNGIFDQIKIARQAVRDDIVGNVAETTESLAFKRTSFSTEDVEEEAFWNRWAAKVKLDARFREAWHVLYTDSQFVCGIWWGTADFPLRGKTAKGNRRRKVFQRMQVPLALTFIDSLKVWPVGSTMFNQERLVYCASRGEAEAFDRTLSRLDPATAPQWNGVDEPIDPVVEKLIEARYTPSLAERQEMQRQGVDASRVYLLRKDSVFRHTHTRPQYEKFAKVRLASVFTWLDIKEQLLQMDRAHLIGGTNFILLIKQGTDKEPAEPEEIAHLRANVRTIAHVPVIVGDHRLNIEIVTPKLDTTLKRERYDTIDARILSRLYRMLVPTGGGQGGEDVEKLGKVIGANLMSERHMLLRSFEEHIFDAIFDRNDTLTDPAKLRFHPARIALEFDPNFATFLADLRASREISRDTILGAAELDQEHEARMLEREKDEYDDIFETAIPFNSPANLPKNQQPDAPDAGTPAEKRRAGRQGGGNRNRGGAAPGTGQGKAPANPRNKSDGRKGSRSVRAELLAEATELEIRGRHRMDVDTLAAAIDAARDDQEGDDE